ncbi:DUF4407 domain-containing protein [uncultured Pedobacter sp.]|uniref:DUF4407 domain-containing protein n=1 Tax=uncultured Pedobacter sp. TaxID=246139 RepID=UPI0025FCEE4E|nr:DUF4407 domain-containing protein [uncultured Pedobacter sp.]
MIIGDFFIWCSGAKKQVLSECPIEKGKFIGMGMAVFFVSILSVISSTFFITYAFAKKNANELSFDIHWQYLLCGILWGIIIFTVDRNIVSTIRKTGVLKNELQKAYPRFILALFIGIVISTPLEMKFFEKEITQKIEEKILSQQIGLNNQTTIPLKNQIANTKEQIVLNTSLRDDAYAKAVAEKNGKGLTGIKRYGPKAKEWETKSFRYSQLVDSLNSNLVKLNDELMNSQDGLSIEKLYDKGIIQKFDGAEMRIGALYELGVFHWVITLLFISLEILPLIVKLMIPRGPYDEILDRMEYEVFIEQKRIISDKNSEINNLLEEIDKITKLKSETRLLINKTKLDAEIKANESLLQDISQKQANLAKIAVKKWYDDELNKLKSNQKPQYITTNTNFQNPGLLTESDNKISGIFWMQKGAVDNTEYYFHNGSLKGNSLLHLKNNQYNKGEWGYRSKHEIDIDLLDNKTEYIILELTDNYLKLKDKLTNEILEFEKSS